MTRYFLSLALLLSLILTEATAAVSLRCDRPDGLYQANSKAIITCTVTASDGPLPTLVHLLITDGIHANKRSQELALVDGKGMLELEGQGHQLVRARLDPQSQKPDAEIGVVFDAASIESSLPAPEDFDAFWAAKKSALAAIPMEVIKREPVSWEASLTEGLHIEQLTIRAWGETPLVGILAYPKGAEPGSLPAKLVVYWAGVYGARQGMKWLCSNDARAGYLTFHINAHGISWLEDDSFYDGLKQGRLHRYPNIGKQDRETSYFLGMYLRVVRGIDYLTDQAPWNGKDLLVEGTSQGGGQALVAAGLDERVTGVVSVVPAMCDQTAVLLGRAPSWPMLNRNQKDKATWEASRYFDAVHFAARAKAPAIFAVGLVDPVCPANHVIAAYNRYGGTKQLLSEPSCAHRLNDALKAKIQASKKDFPAKAETVTNTF